MNTNQSSGGAAGPMSTFMPMNIDAHPLEFTGSGGEYFRVWSVNVLLSIVTLGIYTALDKKFKKKKINRLDTYLKKSCANLG